MNNPPVLKISADDASSTTAIGGASSGAIAAFTVAWERPNEFRKVLSMIGSFTNLRGGGDYPSLIRKMEPKPLRVFQQDGSSDQNIYSGSWYLSNQAVAMTEHERETEGEEKNAAEARINNTFHQDIYSFA